MNRYKGLVDLVFPELNIILCDVGCVSIRRLMLGLYVVKESGQIQAL
jgi:hypothetical protein